MAFQNKSDSFKQSQHAPQLTDKIGNSQYTYYVIMYIVLYRLYYSVTAVLTDVRERLRAQGPCFPT